MGPWNPEPFVGGCCLLATSTQRVYGSKIGRLENGAEKTARIESIEDAPVLLCQMVYYYILPYRNKNPNLPKLKT